jgi:hypothetical protein
MNLRNYDAGCFEQAQGSFATLIRRCIQKFPDSVAKEITIIIIIIIIIIIMNAC